jgi:hypothetical protein
MARATASRTCATEGRTPMKPSAPPIGDHLVVDENGELTVVALDDLGLDMCRSRLSDAATRAAWIAETQ